MNEQNESPSNNNQQADAPSTRQRRGRRWALAGAAAAVIGALSITGISYADEKHNCGMHHRGMGMHGPMDPATAAKRIDGMIERMLPDGTAEQKSKVATIAKAAMDDLRPLREQHRAAREQGIKLLSQPSIDRAALERVRASELQLAEQVSRRITQAMADAAEVLTPEQRARAAEHFKKRMERMG